MAYTELRLYAAARPMQLRLAVADADGDVEDVDAFLSTLDTCVPDPPTLRMNKADLTETLASSSGVSVHTAEFDCTGDVPISLGEVRVVFCCKILVANACVIDVLLWRACVRACVRACAPACLNLQVHRAGWLVGWLTTNASRVCVRALHVRSFCPRPWKLLWTCSTAEVAQLAPKM